MFRKASRWEIPEKYLWPFWLAAIAIAFTHIFFNSRGEAHSHTEGCLHTRHLLEKLETRVSGFENRVVQELSTRRFDATIKADFERLPQEIGVLVDEILTAYMEPEKAKASARELEKKLQELGDTAATLLERNERLISQVQAVAIPDNILNALARVKKPEHRAELLDLFRTEGVYKMEFTPEAMEAVVDTYTGSSPVKLQDQVKKVIGLISNDPKHPSLKTHSLDPVGEYLRLKKEGKSVQSSIVSVAGGGYRMLWYRGPKEGQITIYKLIHHDNY